MPRSGTTVFSLTQIKDGTIGINFNSFEPGAPPSPTASIQVPHALGIACAPQAQPGASK